MDSFERIINDFITKFAFEDIQFHEPDDLDINKVMTDKKYKNLRRNIKDYLQDKIDESVGKLKRTTKKRTINKNQPIGTTNESSGDPVDRATVTYLVQAIGACSPNEVKNFIEKESISNVLNDMKSGIPNDEVQNYLHDALMECGLKKLTTDKSKSIIKSTLAGDKVLKRLFRSLKDSKNKLFRDNGIERVVLPEVHIFNLEANILPKFLATLNICNRSACRHLRNNSEDNFKHLVEEEFHRKWLFPQSKRLIFDNHKFTIKDKLNDETSELGGYATILILINGIIDELNGENIVVSDEIDKDVAIWIRQILQGKKRLEIGVNSISTRLMQMVKYNLIKITHLLFGSEVVRNPASLIHQQMMLDLIIVGGMTWRDALDSKIHEGKSDGGEMPMSMKKAVDSFRILHYKFLRFMPHEYIYDPAVTEEGSVKVEELLKREHEIMEKWFWYYTPELYDIDQNLNVLGKIDENVKLLRDNICIEAIIEQSVYWYGIHLLRYTGDQIDTLLKFYLNGSQIVILDPTSMTDFDSNKIASIIKNIKNSNTAAVIPLNIHNNHWVGITFRMGNEQLNAIYSDPLGNSLSTDNFNLFSQALVEGSQGNFQIIDLQLKQQISEDDSGPISVNNLVRLSLSNFGTWDKDAIIESAKLIKNTTQDDGMRQRHSNILQNAMIMAVKQLLEIETRGITVDSEPNNMTTQIANMAINDSE